jgi:predicted dehydrogenase
MVLASCYVKWNRTSDYYTGWKGRISEDGGGAVINQAIHGVDLLQWFAGMPVEVFAWTTQRVHAIESEDTAVAALKFGSGAFGAIEASTALWPGFSRRIEICGENGSAVMEDDDIARWEFRVAQPQDDAFRGAPSPDPGFHRRHPRAAAVLHRGQRGTQGRGAGAGYLRFGGVRHAGSAGWCVNSRRFTRRSRNVHKSLMQSSLHHVGASRHGSEAITPAAGMRFGAVFHR